MTVRTDAPKRSQNRNVIWEPNPGPQSAFLACPAREVLYAGSVGSGKTDGLLMCAVSQTANRAHRGLLLRRMCPMLRDLIGRSHELFLPLGASFNKQESMWHFPSGAIVEFGFLDADEDKFRYMGRQFSMIGWDELTSWPGDGTDNSGTPVSSAYLYMMSRLRAVEGSGLRLEIRATCTPGNIGHNWVRSRFSISMDGSASEVIDPQTGYRRVFIPARISDNPFLHNTEYERSLAALPEASRKALLEGRWDVFEGSIFSEFDHRVHTCEPFRIPIEWPMYRSADDGFAEPFAAHWYAMDKCHNRLYVTDEIYQRGLLPKQAGLAVLEMDESYGRELDGVLDSSSWAEVGMGTGSGKGSRAEIMNSMGCEWQPSSKGPGSRIAGLSAIHARLGLQRDGFPGLVIFRHRCPNLIRELPALVYSKINREDADDSCSDHAVASLRYGLTRRVMWSGKVRVYGL